MAEAAADAVVVLARQHRELLEMIRGIDSGPRIGGRVRGDPLRRLQRQIDDLRRCFVIHERSKQRYLWPVLRRAWPDGKALAGAAWARRARVEDRFVKLRWFSEHDARAATVLDEALAGIAEHVSLESHVLGRMRRTLPRPVLEQAGARLARRDFLVPVRPHPHLPSQPWLVTALGPVVGLADRVVEALSFGPSGA